MYQLKTMNRQNFMLVDSKKERNKYEEQREVCKRDYGYCL